jgi:hypothetical protein
VRGVSSRRRTSARQQLALAIVCALAGGCATATLDVVSPVPVTIDAVTLTIRDETGDAMTPDQIRSLKRAVTRELLAAGIDVMPSAKKGAVNVVGSVVRYDPGVRALRFVSRWGFGTGALEIQWDVEDRHSDSLARCDVEGSVSMGTFGGSFDDVQAETGKALARCLKGDLR